MAKRRRRLTRKGLAVITFTAGIIMGILICTTLRTDKKIPQQNTSVSIETTETEVWLVDTEVDKVDNSEIINEMYSTRLCRCISEEEFYNLQMIAMCESENQGEESMTAVVAVVLNRMQSEKFKPNTVETVIFQENQFSPALPNQDHDGGSFQRHGREMTLDSFSPDIQETGRNAVIDAINGVDPSDGALFYFAPDIISEEEATLRKYLIDPIVIGDQIFYKGYADM